MLGKSKENTVELGAKPRLRDGWGEGGTPPAEGWMEGWGAPKARTQGKPRKLKQKLRKNIQGTRKRKES